MKTSLDARGLACPLPVVKANEALAGMTGGTLEVHADNAVAVENLKRLAAGLTLPSPSRRTRTSSSR